MNDNEAKRKIREDQERAKKKEQRPKCVLEVKRIHEGPACVLGIIVSVSESYLLEQTYSGSKVYRDAKSIQLEDIEKPEDNERLDVILYDDMINGVMAGEVVEISGAIAIENKKENSKTKKKVNVLHADSIKYIHRKELVISDIDINNIQKFASVPNLIQRLNSMFAPNIIGIAKLGILRSIVGGVERGRIRGRINTFMVGDPGTAKSTLAREAVDVKPNSRYVSGPHSSARTITAIMDKENDGLVLRLGAIRCQGVRYAR